MVNHPVSLIPKMSNSHQKTDKHFEREDEINSYLGPR